MYIPVYKVAATPTGVGPAIGMAGEDDPNDPGRGHDPELIKQMLAKAKDVGTIDWPASMGQNGTPPEGSVQVDPPGPKLPQPAGPGDLIERVLLAAGSANEDDAESVHEWEPPDGPEIDLDLAGIGLAANAVNDGLSTASNLDSEAPDADALDVAAHMAINAQHVNEPEPHPYTFVPTWTWGRIHNCK